MTYEFEEFITEFRDIDSVAVLTGAGISAESGVPTFRGKGGVWEITPIEEVATISAFRRNPVKVWEWFNGMRENMGECQPNRSHYALAGMEKYFEDFTVITQNIDDYHSVAGSRNVVELHGNAGWDRCWDCGIRIKAGSRKYNSMPPKCYCGGTMKPDVVFFGESLSLDDLKKAWDAAGRCQFMLVVGTSAIVEPAATIPYIAKRSGAKVIEFNLEPTGHTSIADLSLFESASTSLTRITETLDIS